jgi:galactokinase
MERVDAFARALEDREDAVIASLLADGHRSLRDDYEVSCDELDCLVEAAGSTGLENGHVGTRMTGGGFGGSTISLVKRAAAEDVRRVMQDAFEQSFGRRPASFVTAAVEGARRIS